MSDREFHRVAPLYWKVRSRASVRGREINRHLLSLARVCLCETSVVSLNRSHSDFGNNELTALIVKSLCQLDFVSCFMINKLHQIKAVYDL